MVSFLGNRIKDNTDINDQVIANNALAAANGAASAYLQATLTAPTPELKALYASSLTQVIEKHTALVELNTKRGWDKPYDAPSNQLTSAYQESKSIVKDK